jgi:nitrite reductase/ring-hydroxylating ferredoxin subunit
MIMRGITRYIEDLVRSKRPRRFRASEEEIGLARTAITLRAARPASGEPAEEFVTALHKKLAAELDPPTVSRAAGARRTFLRTAAVAGAAAAGAVIDHMLTSRRRSAPMAAGTLMPTPGAWRFAAKSADLPEGGVLEFTVGAIDGFVEREGGQLRAVSRICTHQGCRLGYAARPAQLVCPCHGAKFALDGAVLSHPFPNPLPALPTIPVREANGIIQVYATQPGL